MRLRQPAWDIFCGGLALLRPNITKQTAQTTQQGNDGAQATQQGTVCSVQEDRTAPPGRYRPLWEILKVSDGKVTHHFHQKGTFGLNGEVSFTRKGR